MSESTLLFLHALTGMHPGSGTALGVVDLPVQRERHTQWPTIPGSAVKGVLRDRCRRSANGNGEDSRLTAVFGPETIRSEGDSYAGAVSFTDARLLAFPVRSLKGVFAWVTCPAVLMRLHRDLSIKGDKPSFPVPSVAERRFLSSSDKALLVDNSKIVLEEFDFETAGPDGGVADWIAQHAVNDDATAARIKTHLVVLCDDDFTHFVRFATEVTARIGLDHEKKTVKTGALFYQEFLPAETLFYSLVFAESSRKKDVKMEPAQALKFVRDNVPTVIQVGGDETIGKGICAVKFGLGA